jgi:hypothetical protein
MLNFAPSLWCSKFDRFCAYYLEVEKWGAWMTLQQRKSVLKLFDGFLGSLGRKSSLTSLMNLDSYLFRMYLSRKIFFKGMASMGSERIVISECRALSVATESLVKVYDDRS